VRLINSIVYPFIFLSLLWIIMLYQYLTGISLGHYGVYPRHVEGLEGIIFMPLLHASFTHLLSNSLPLLILGAGVIYFYREVAAKVIAIIYFMTGALVWIFARGGVDGHAVHHIGASGIIYGFAAFLFFGGIFRKNPRLMAISLLILIYYGGLFWGALPGGNPNISWEGHLCGAIAGIFAAYIYKNKGPKPKKYDWEDEPDSIHPGPHISQYWEVKPRGE